MSRTQILADKRLETYRKALQMYESGEYPENWLEGYEKCEVLNFGLCQVLRTICMDMNSLSEPWYSADEQEEWGYSDTPKYFPEFGNHWDRHTLDNQMRIDILKLCIQDLESSEVNH